MASSDTHKEFMKDSKHTCQSQGVRFPEPLSVPYPVTVNRQATSFIVVIRIYYHQRNTLPFDNSVPYAVSETGITFRD